MRNHRKFRPETVAASPTAPQPSRKLIVRVARRLQVPFRCGAGRVGPGPAAFAALPLPGPLLLDEVAQLGHMEHLGRAMVCPDPTLHFPHGSFCGVDIALVELDVRESGQRGQQVRLRLAGQFEQMPLVGKPTLPGREL